MKSLKTFNRECKRFSTLSSLKKKWQDLSSYITKDSDMSNWRDLNAKIFEAEVLVQKDKGHFKKIDWSEWNEKISNKELLLCMKNFYDSQISALEEIEAGEEKEAKSGMHQKSKTHEEDILFEEALKNCKKAEENSAKLLIDGAKTLWISFHNPPVNNLDNNEWMDSDLYWQAFVEKHSVYNLNSKNLSPEDEENRNLEKNEWHKKTMKFNERSDTPILYDYMINLPSWEYYDINRRIFLENLIYFLLRTGLNYRFFPELFRWKWKTHIEDLRFQYLEIAQKRRKDYQLEKVKREVALELQPIDYEHKGEEFHLKLLHHFRDYQNVVLSRLMSNYIFLCQPYIPIQTKEGLSNVLKKYTTGKLYKLNDQITCLFFLPDHLQVTDESNNLMYKPLDALNNFYNYLKSKNVTWNDSYHKMLHIFTQVLQERGQYWLNIPNESIPDSFLRKYNKDDSLFPVFVQYVSQLKEIFSNKIEIPIKNYEYEIAIIHKKYNDECAFFHSFVKAFLPDDITLLLHDNNLPDFFKLNENEIKQLVKDGQIRVIDENTNEEIVEPSKILAYVKGQEAYKQELQEFVKSLPA
ncbi:ATP synthase F0 subunit d-like protein [Plasmodium brasilianum]|uniref:Uncharacterized protein n=2 Tax=Plasmodium (Plasmodium) TaxID=418103 RepID=A0A1A8VYP3_PLAMA|nr:conserved protein, unknown function [Plasmodium malariae]KAI4838969.1 ATP synthase F0 subunit d-like protein [Plasmodium brasilianum]SBS84827.1 conserved protein, unknown function [Plasmodium malariae]SCN12317.1 conserved protein, unknown function [Plasmodium malariae]